MAILHRATITPTKLELAAAWLDRQGAGGAGDLEMVGSYRFDDPEGEVGIEALLVRRASEVFHLPVTYRGAPLDGAGAHLITTMEHSVLGRRWVYEAEGDAVALACYVAALAGRQEQASLELWDGDVAGRQPAGRRLVAAWDAGSGVVAVSAA